MKKKGFTLIELIVVIAIIGVLAAILVPAMLGYVKKSKITTANTTAKSIYNAFNSALTDMDSEDIPIKNLGNQTGTKTGTSANTFYATTTTAWSSGNETTILKQKVSTYFSDIAKVSAFEAKINNGGACVGVGAMNGSYPGSYPKPMSTDEYDKVSSWTASSALSFAVKDLGV
jgi:type IV pilus assembly protein PilA